jgi:hypothetical protein
MMREFYEELYLLEDVTNLGEVIDVIPNKLTAEMNDKLLKPIKGEEVKKLYFRCFPQKP